MQRKIHDVAQGGHNPPAYQINKNQEGNIIMNKKYELVNYNEETGLWQIRALRDFGYVKVGDLGGWVKDESNLSQDGNCWVYDNAQACGNAQVYGGAQIYGNARVFDGAKVYDNAQVYGYAWVNIDACVFGNAWIYGDAQIYGNARAFDNARVSGDAWVNGNAQVCGNAQVNDNACVYDNARVYGDACVFGDAWIYGNAQVFDDARVFDNAQVSGDAWVHGDAEVCFDMRICHARHDKFIRFYNPGVHPITVDGEHLNIGCKSQTIKGWLEIASIVGKKEGYTEEEIQMYIRCIQMIHDEVYGKKI